MTCNICGTTDETAFHNSSWDDKTLICYSCVKYEKVLSWNITILKSKVVYDTWSRWRNKVLRIKGEMER